MEDGKNPNKKLPEDLNPQLPQQPSPADLIINTSQSDQTISYSLSFFFIIISWIFSFFSFLDSLLSGRISNWFRQIYSTFLSINLGLQNDPAGSRRLRYTVSANLLPTVNTRFIPFITIPSLSREFQLGLATIQLTFLSTTGFLVLNIMGYFPDFVQDFLPTLTIGGGVITVGLTLNDTNLPIIITSIIQQVGNSSIFFLFFGNIALLLGSPNLVFIPCICFLLIMAVFIWLITRYFSSHGGGGGGPGGGGGDGPFVTPMKVISRNHVVLTLVGWWVLRKI